MHADLDYKASNNHHPSARSPARSRAASLSMRGQDAGASGGQNVVDIAVEDIASLPDALKKAAQACLYQIVAMRDVSIEKE